MLLPADSSVEVTVSDNDDSAGASEEEDWLPELEGSLEEEEGSALVLDSVEEASDEEDKSPELEGAVVGEDADSVEADSLEDSASAELVPALADEELEAEVLDESFSKLVGVPVEEDPEEVLIASVNVTDSDSLVEVSEIGENPFARRELVDEEGDSLESVGLVS